MKFIETKFLKCIATFMLLFLFSMLVSCVQTKDTQIYEEGDDSMGDFTLAVNEDVTLTYKAGPADNPLKGFVPYKGVYDFPHSMEWWYIPLKDLMNGPDSYTFDTGLEPILNEMASRGHQAVFRIYLEYPGKDTGVPEFLIKDGLKFFNYTEFGGGKNPDYHNPKLIDTLLKFIDEFGKRYDGDPRIGFITCGLIGHWGEWHTYPDDDMMPSVEDQNKLFRAYDNAFNKTKIQARYPDSGDLAKMDIGFHDDSFSYQTLSGISWHFMSRMERAGAVNKWKTQPVGGELRPEVQVSIWDETPDKNAEDYSECVDTAHASWLMAHHVFTEMSPGDDNYRRALEGAKRLGYDLYVSNVVLRESGRKAPLEFEVDIQNKGVAPFYYDWRVEIGVADADNNMVDKWDASWKLTGILPGEPVTFNFKKDDHYLNKGIYKLLLRVNNPLPLGNLFRFANEEQDSDIKGWLSLGTFKVK